MKKRNIVWSVLISSIFAITMIIVIFIKDKDQYIALEGRQANTFIKPTYNNIMNNEFQNAFETAYKDQFIGRETIFILNNRIESLLHYISSRTHAPYTLYEVGENVYRFTALGENYLTEFPIIKTPTYEDDIKQVVNNINELSNKYNNINFYIYDCFRLNLVDWFDKDNLFTSYGKYYRDVFASNLNDDILYYSYYPQNIEEYAKYYFKTDPHWNTYGSYNIGYRKIIDMFNEKYQDMNYLEPVGEYVYDNYDYYGQYGRQSLYASAPDTFVDLKFDIPEYITIVNGEEKEYDHVEEFENGTADPLFWPYIYNNIHGNDEKEVIFKTNNNNGRVLLSFVDSYSAPIKYLIASHFDEAIFIDLRLYPNFNIDQYINKYGVTDILYLEFYGTLYKPNYIINID